MGERRDHSSLSFGTLTVALVAMGAVLLLVVGGCTKRRPTEPEPVKYNVYFGSSGYNNIYIVDLDSLLYSDAPPIMDSIPGFNTITGLVVSDDGRWMYVQSRNRIPPFDPALKKIDLLTRDTVAILPANRTNSKLAAIDAGKVFLRGNHSFITVTGCMQEVINAETMTVTTILPDSVCGWKGPREGTSIAVSVGGTSRLRGLNLKTGEYWGEYIARVPGGGQTLHVTEAFLHPSDTLVAAIATTGGEIEVWFLVGDLNSGGIVFSVRLARSAGTVDISADGRFCLVTDPVGLLGGTPTVDLIDLSGPTHLRRFTWADGLEVNAGQTLFLPMERYALVGSPPPNFGGGDVDLLDYSDAPKLRAFEWYFESREAGGIAVGPKPK